MLSELFQRITIAPAVRDEAIARAPTPVEAAAISNEAERLGFVPSTPKPDILKRLARRYDMLGRGELETLALVASRMADVALVDDRIARQVAGFEGIPVVGTLGVLLRAYRTDAIFKADLAKLLERLTASGLWLAPDVLEAFWASLGGR